MPQLWWTGQKLPDQAGTRGVGGLLDQWSFLVPLVGGKEHIITQLAIYKWYILPIGGFIYHRSHLLSEPGNSIDVGVRFLTVCRRHVLRLCTSAADTGGGKFVG